MRRLNLCSLILLVLLISLSIRASSIAPLAKKPFEGITIRVLMQSGHTAAGELHKEVFEKFTGAKVEIIGVPYGAMYQKIMTAFVTGAVDFDVVEYTYPWLASFAKYLEPLDDLYKGVHKTITKYAPPICNETGPGIWDPKDFLPLLLDLYCKAVGPDGKVHYYGVPEDGDVHILYYRTDLFEKAGLKPPSTWDEYIEIAKKLTDPKRGIYGTVLMLQRGYEGFLGHFIARFGAYGGKWFDEKMRPMINSTAAVKAVLNLVKVLPYCPPGVLSYTYTESMRDFIKGKAAMAESWVPDYYLLGNDPKISKIVGKVGYALMPAGPAGKVCPLVGGWALAIPKGLSPEKKRAAMAYILYATSRPATLRATLLKTTVDAPIPANYKDPRLLKAAPVVKVEVEAFKIGMGVPKIPEWPRLWDVLSAKIHELLTARVTDEATIKKALDEVALEWYKILKEAGYYKS